MGNQQSQNKPFEINEIIDQLNWIPSFTDINTNSLPDDYCNLEQPNKEYIDHRNKISEIFDVDDFNLQVIKTFSIVFRHELYSENLPVIIPSLNYLRYYLIKKFKHSFFSFQYLFTVIREVGVCSEKNYSSNIENIQNGIPTYDHYCHSQIYKYMKYYKLDLNHDKIKAILANGKIIMLGMPVYTSFMKTRTNIDLELPSDQDIYIGGLSGVIVGYNEKKKIYIVQIHRGRYWGNEGSIHLPYEYVEKMRCVELWVIDINKKMIHIQNNTIQSIHMSSHNGDQESNKYQADPKLEFHPFGV